MEICHAHNATKDLTSEKAFGIRVRIGPRDSFARLLGTDWERTHWYATRYERDEALADMSSRHIYSRRGDSPTLLFEAIEQDTEEAG
jgi:hypothetical protein